MIENDELNCLKESNKQYEAKIFELSEKLEMAENCLEESNRYHMMTDTAIKSLESIHKVQWYGLKGGYDEYNQGLYNGLELALSIILGREPEYAQPYSRTACLSVDGKDLAKEIRKHAYTGL